MWDQYYLGLTHRAGDKSRLALKTTFNYYHTRDQGQQRLGYIDNDAFSLALTGSHQAHSLTLAWQQVFGNEYFDYIWESTGNYMANSLYSDYNGPNEKSWQLRYDLDLAAYGVPGLSASLWHAKAGASMARTTTAIAMAATAATTCAAWTAPSTTKTA